MTEREKFEANEKKRELLILCGYRCQVCGTRNTRLEMAHIIPKHKKYLKKYGKDIIHHSKNIRITCPGRCNDSVLMDPATHPVECEKHVAKIRDCLEKERLTNGANWY